ncbi:MAG: L,D-transpeptidase family protein, partial [Sphingomonadaceae bacterium]
MRSLFLLVLLLLARPVLAQPTLGQPPLVPPAWTLAQAGELAAAIDGAAAHGLPPERYARAALWQAIGRADATALADVANAAFRRLAADLMAGAAPPPARQHWHVGGPQVSPERLDALVAEALGGRGVVATLAELPPAHAAYRALQAALASTPPDDSKQRQTLAANLERWRWMPRSLGADHILVNVPAFEVQLVRGGQPVATHRVIVGKPRTPTPQFAAMVSAVTFNPDWV